MVPTVILDRFAAIARNWRVASVADPPLGGTFRSGELRQTPSILFGENPFGQERSRFTIDLTDVGCLWKSTRPPRIQSHRR